MFPTLSDNLNPLPLAVEVMRANLRHHDALTQRNLGAVAVLVRTAGDQAGARAAGTLAEPLIGATAQAATAIAGGMIDVARLVCEMQARSASDLLSWWESRLQRVTMASDHVRTVATPARPEKAGTGQADTGAAPATGVASKTAATARTAVPSRPERVAPASGVASKTAAAARATVPSRPDRATQNAAPKTPLSAKPAAKSKKTAARKPAAAKADKTGSTAAAAAPRKVVAKSKSATRTSTPRRRATAVKAERASAKPSPRRGKLSIG